MTKAESVASRVPKPPHFMGCARCPGDIGFAPTGTECRHRSFKEQGIDREPTIHIGATASALERKGVQTERGNINRETPKAWRSERERLEREMPQLRSERARACHDLAFAEVISYNKTNLERMEQNENRDSRQADHEQATQKKRREESL